MFERLVPTLLFLAILLSPPWAEGEDGAVFGGEVKVELEASTLVLGTDQGTRVSISPPDDATAVAVFARHGTVDRIEIDDNGLVVASYAPPTQFIPRVDVIAARVETSEGPVWGYASILLVGQGLAKIKTSPKAMATIKIGQKSFGPVRADRKGKAEIRVEVSPGVSKGVDGEGQDVDLHVPPVARVAIFSGSQETGGKDQEQADLFVVILTPKGAPDTTAEPLLESDSGEITELVKLRDNMWSARFTPSDTASGLVKIFAKAQGEDLPPSFATVLVEKQGGFEGESKAASVEIKNEAGDKKEEGESNGQGEGETDSSITLSAALSAGYSWNLGTLHGPSLAADFLVFLPFADGNWALGLEGGFFFGADETDVAEVAGVKSRTWMVPLMFEAAYRLETSSPVGLLFSLKGGGVMMQHLMDFSGAGTQDTTERIYSGVVGGSVAMTFAAGPGAFTFKIGYLYFFSRLETLEGNISPASAEIGYRLYF